MPIEKLPNCDVQKVLKDLEKLPKGIAYGKDSDVPKKDLKNQFLFLATLHDALKNSSATVVSNNAIEIIAQVVHDLEAVNNDKAVHLCVLLKSPHLKSLVAVHDNIAKQCTLAKQYNNYEKTEELDELQEWEVPVRMIGLTKREGDSLGLTVAVENNEVVVSRILHGGLIHKQGLMHVGDVIREVNGKSVQGDPALLKACLAEANGSLTIKIIPSYQVTPSPNASFMKCNFDYCPDMDPYIPSKEAGLSFKQNDVIKIVDRRDLKWWQAQLMNDKGEAMGRAGLVPSLELQERRQFFAKRSGPSHRKVICKMYKLSDYYQQYVDDFFMYEEVALLPPFTRKCVFLVSHDSSIAHEVREQLVKIFPSFYKAPVIHTSSSLDSSNYDVCSKEAMLKEIKNNRFFEFTEIKGEIFGTKYESIRNVIKSGKTCVKDILPKNLKFVMTSEFMPYVIFLKPESDIAESFLHCINLTLPFYDVYDACNVIHKNLIELAKQQQWVPISWLF